MNKSILIIHTGGTIGMKPTERGFDLCPGYTAELVSSMPQLLNKNMPKFEVIEHDPLIDSANVTPKHWGKIAATIARYYDEFAGFIVLHGTDTMSYTASALSFMLENLGKPVILTGAQVPLASLRTDARDNLINSLYIASHFEFNEVALCFHDVLLRGNRTKKISSVDYNAFGSPNLAPLARIEVIIKFNEHLRRGAPSVGFSIREIKDLTIANINLFPGMTSQYLAGIFDANLDALVVGTYGLGNAPINDVGLMEIFKEAADRGVILVNYTQCFRGHVDMSTYSVGQALADIGFISAFDMTIEAAITKLYYLLSCDLSIDDVKKQMQADLRGELSLSGLN